MPRPPERSTQPHDPSRSSRAAAGEAFVTSVPLLDVSRGNAALREDILAAVTRVCDSGRFIFGPDCQALEESLAARCGARHGIASASGSDALLLALMAHDVGPGDEVIVPSFTFFATASAARRLGARPVFVDIDPATFNGHPAAVAAAVTPATRAIIPVHLFGQCADMDPIRQTAARHGLPVIEDAAQAIDASYRGLIAGAIGHIGCFSFYPTKNLGGFGDGGLMTTSDDALAERLRLLRGHGMQPRYYHREVGINSRLDSIQAAVLNVKLTRLAEGTAARRAHAARYAEMFQAARLDGVLVLPTAAPDRGHVWNQYTIRVPQGRRDALRAHLAACGVGTEIYYPVPLHAQECFRDLGYGPGSLPETERAAAEVLSLPIFPELTVPEQATVVGRIAEFFHGAGSHAARAVAPPHFAPSPATERRISQ
jgi:dTDP-4-amino-4,6-dideoxygalactose transaminase